MKLRGSCPLSNARTRRMGLTVLNEWPNGDRVIPEVQEILRLIAERDAILDTCHLVGTGVQLS